MSALPRSEIAAPAGWTVVEMTAQDIDLVERIERAVYEFPWTAGNFRDSLASGYRCMVCRSGDALAGYAIQMFVIDEAHLLNITIAPEQQGRGHGSRLLHWLMDDARGRGMTSLFLEVRRSNRRAQILYGRLGFSQVGVRRDYYPAHGGREDALIFKTSL
jgi:[ribosomal protein S18]-alanine N-acetyltransferase